MSIWNLVKSCPVKENRSGIYSINLSDQEWERK